MIRLASLFLVAFVALPAFAQQVPPKGDLQKFVFAESKIFPGTSRTVTVYVPKQYDGKTPACLWVCQDGVQYNAPAVFDKLIASKEMPITIGVFVTPGEVKASNKDALARFNRSLEYDGLGDSYARFLIEELLPAVEKMKSSDGREIKFSKNPDDRAIGGASSGAICAFTAAWERPDSFRRVFSAIGTYVGLRGGNNYPTLLRKYEPKPLRVFLEDGEGDLDNLHGNWPLANKQMDSSLRFMKYESKLVMGDGGHNGKHGGAILPESLIWLFN